MEPGVVSPDAEEEAKHLSAIESISQQLRLPPATVAEVYGRELARIRQDALITTYLSIFVSRRVNEMLRTLSNADRTAPEGHSPGPAH